MNGNTSLTAGEWVKLTTTPVKALTIQNLGGGTVIVAGGAAPSGEAGIRLAPGEALSAGTQLSEVFPGVGETMDVHARAISRDAKVFVSYA